MIHLERTVDVLAFDALATVAVGRKRPEFLAVARLAADLGGSLDGATIARELLGGLSVAGSRVIERAVSLGLLVRDDNRGPARLSEAGAKALEVGVVLVPEERLWRFYTLADPLVDDALLHVAPVPSTAAKDERDALQSAKRGGPAVERKGDAPGELLCSLAVKGRLWTSVATGALFEAHELAASGAKATGGRITISLDCAPGAAPRVAIRGQLNAPDGASSKVDRSLGTPSACRGIGYEALWFELASRASGVPLADLRAWRERAGALVLPTAFDERLGEPERKTFRSSFAVAPTTLQGVGAFVATRLDDLSLVPRSDRDATEWAQWLQWSALDRYASRPMLEESRGRVRSRFPCHQPSLATDEQLLRRARGAPHDPRARFLLAPFDLGLWS